MAERPRELGDFKKARVNGGTNNHSLKDVSAAADRPASYGNQIVSSTRPIAATYIFQRSRGGCDQYCRRPSDVYTTDRRTKLTALETINRWLILNKRLSYCRGTARRATSVEILWPFLTELLTRSSANPEEPCEHTVSWNRVNCCTNVRRIACENVCNRWMTFKVIQGHCRCHHLIGHILFHISLPL